MKQNKKYKNRQSRSWILAGMLFTVFCVTTALLGIRLTAYSKNDEMIALVPMESEEKVLVKEVTELEEVPVEESKEELPEEEEAEETVPVRNLPPEQIPESLPAVTALPEDPSENPIKKRVAKPQFEVEDDEQIWTTETEIEIFKISYKNGDGEVTVNGGDDKVIAPGTTNDYRFCLKNTGNVKIDYMLEIEAFFTPEDIYIPVQARLKGYNGDWMLGGSDEWEEVLKLDGITDEATLRVNNYAYYTLEWQWPYESGDDAYDTLLGDQAVDEDLELTIIIRTTAVGYPESDDDDDPIESLIVALQSVQTGDRSQVLLWTAVSVASLVTLIGLFVVKRRRTEESEDIDETI